MKSREIVVKVAALFMGALASSAFGVVRIENAPNVPAVAAAVKDTQEILGACDFTIRCQTDASLAAQEWRLKSDGRTLVVTGRDGLGVTYGLYSFLEEVVGCRWYAPDTKVIPGLDGWKLPVFERSGRPAILSRESYAGQDFIDGKWRLRNKETVRSAGGDSECCGKPGGSHTFADYAKALGRNDEKAGEDWFCLTDPGIRKAVAETMKKFIRADREKAVAKGLPPYEWPTLYELSQNDGGMDFHCRCADCLRLRDAAGSWSGPNIAFASAVADEVAKEFPDVWVRTFAYSYTERPPTNDFRAAKNLIIRYCRSFLFQPLSEKTDNGEIFRRWNDRVDRKFVWSYWRSYSGPLFPAVKPRDDIQDEMRFCRDMHVHGYFAEAESPLSRSFGMMNHWILLKMTENPDLSARKLADEFIHAYYGAAKGPITEYLDYLEKREKQTYSEIDPAFLLANYSGHLAMYTQRGYLDRDFFATADRLLDQAERLVADDSKALSHVRIERLVFDRTVLDTYQTAQAAGVDVVAAARRIAVEAPAVIESWGFDKKNRKERMEAAAREGERSLAFAAHYPVAEPTELKGRSYEVWSMPSIRRKFTQVTDVDSPFGCAGYDPKQKPTEKINYILTPGLNDNRVTRVLKRSEVPQDEKFHLVKIGKMPIVCEDGAWFGECRGRTWLPCFVPSNEEREFWVSVKFTGPSYVKGSTQPDRVLYDRFFIVK